MIMKSKDAVALQRETILRLLSKVEKKLESKNLTLSQITFCSGYVSALGDVLREV